MAEEQPAGQFQLRLDLGFSYDTNVVLLGDDTSLPVELSTDDDFRLGVGTDLRYLQPLGDDWLMGIGGSVIGCATLMYITKGKVVTPISPIGFPVAIAGAFILLVFYERLAGHFFSEAEDGDRSIHRRGRRRFSRRRRRDLAYYVDD